MPDSCIRDVIVENVGFETGVYFGWVKYDATQRAKIVDSIKNKGAFPRGYNGDVRTEERRSVYLTDRRLGYAIHASGTPAFFKPEKLEPNLNIIKSRVL